MEQLSILTENKPGSMSRILKILGDNNINILGISTERGPLAEVRLMLDEPEKAKEIFETEHNIIVSTVDVTVVKLEDKPGELGKLTGLLAEKGINIDYCYGFGKKEDFGLVAMKFSETNGHNINDILSDFLLL
ncbi:MAG: ACT domain-containing protein [Candidatus Heimdallarchaeota archaeon]|nr:ACT domain-containing protein [Candidatus Heimdallarchaeota archaeon]